MPRISEMTESKFLKQGDVDNDGLGCKVTIAAIRQYNVAMQGAGEELKWCVEFRELDKPLVLNVTNMRLLEKITGSDDTDDWIGKTVVLYNDETVMYKGEVTGGIRVRAPRIPKGNGGQKPQQAPPEPIAEEEVPF